LLSLLTDSVWRPIESAPRDGTPVLAYFAARFNHDAAMDVVQYQGGRWYCVNTIHADEWTIESPTHWTPLPDPPSETVGR
jgi:hypothetical protein